MSSLFVNKENGIYYTIIAGEWCFWGAAWWVPSEDAKPDNVHHQRFLENIVLVGNNFRLK